MENTSPNTAQELTDAVDKLLMGCIALDELQNRLGSDKMRSIHLEIDNAVAKTIRQVKQFVLTEGLVTDLLAIKDGLLPEAVYSDMIEASTELALV